MQQLDLGEKPIMMQKEVTYEEKMEEEMFLGLRKNRGVSLTVFEQKYSKTLHEVYGKEIKELIHKELVALEEDHIFLTTRGRFVGNEVFQYFLK